MDMYDPINKIWYELKLRKGLALEAIEKYGELIWKCEETLKVIYLIDDGGAEIEDVECIPIDTFRVEAREQGLGDVLGEIEAVREEYLAL